MHSLDRLVKRLLDNTLDYKRGPDGKHRIYYRQLEFCPCCGEPIQIKNPHVDICDNCNLAVVHKKHRDTLN